MHAQSCPKCTSATTMISGDFGDLYISTYSDNFVNYTSGIHGLKRTVRVPCNNNYLWRSSCVEIHQQTLRFSKYIVLSVSC